MDNDPNLDLVTNSPYLLVSNPFYIPLQPPHPPPAPPPHPPPAPPPVPNFPDLVDDFNINDINLDIDNPPHENNPLHENVPFAPDMFHGLWNGVVSENHLIGLLQRWLGNEPLNVGWINIGNFYEFSPSILAGISVQREPNTYYFITPVVMHSQNRANRNVGGGGAWCHSGRRAKQLMDGGVRIGTRRSYHYQHPPEVADATRWLMKEFTIYPPHEVNNFALVKLHRPQ